MSNPYSFLPEVRRAMRQAEDAERTAERLGDVLAQALLALAAYDLTKAQALRGQALNLMRGRLPTVAGHLACLPLARQSTHDA